MMILSPVQLVLGQLSHLLKQLSCDQYRQSLLVLNGASIGQHVRHSIELFQCLIEGYKNGLVNYDNRKRDLNMETNRVAACDSLEKIVEHLNLDNKPMILESVYGEAHEVLLSIETNFYREVVYNLEHVIHHMALIRIGVQHVSNISLDAAFGVAPSTIQYRKACAQ